MKCQKCMYEMSEMHGFLVLMAQSRGHPYLPAVKSNIKVHFKENWNIPSTKLRMKSNQFQKHSIRSKHHTPKSRCNSNNQPRVSYWLNSLSLKLASNEIKSQYDYEIACKLAYNFARYPCMSTSKNGLGL